MWAMVWGWLVVCRVPVGGEEVAGSPAGGCRSWGHNHNLGAASLGLALCPEPGGFRSQMSQQPWREGGKGTQEGRCLAPLSPKPQWPVRLKAPEPGLCIRPSRGLAGGLSPPSRAQPPTVGMDPLAPCSPHKRLRLRFASSLGVGLTSKNEFEENRRRSRHATAPSAHWPPHEVLANHPGGHKVAASPQGSQPGGVTPSRHRPELGHPACGHSVFGGHCSVWSSDSCS